MARTIIFSLFIGFYISSESFAYSVRDGGSTLHYNTANELVRVDYYSGAQVRYFYFNKNLSKIVYPNGDVVEYNYNTQNQLLAFKTPLETIEFHYQGKRIKSILSSSGTKTSYEWNKLGRPINIVQNYGSSELVTTYQYDSLNRVVQNTQKRGGKIVRQVKFEYDHTHLKKITKIFSNKNTQTIRFKYNKYDLPVSINDSFSGKSEFTYNNDHQLTALTNRKGSYRYIWDKKDLVSVITDKGNISLDWNSNGTISRVHLPSERNINFGHSDIGELNKISTASDHLIYLPDYTTGRGGKSLAVCKNGKCQYDYMFDATRAWYQTIDTYGVKPLGEGLEVLKNMHHVPLQSFFASYAGLGPTHLAYMSKSKNYPLLIREIDRLKSVKKIVNYVKVVKYMKNGLDVLYAGRDYNHHLNNGEFQQVHATAINTFTKAMSGVVLGSLSNAAMAEITTMAAVGGGVVSMPVVMGLTAVVATGLVIDYGVDYSTQLYKEVARAKDLRTQKNNDLFFLRWRGVTSMIWSGADKKDIVQYLRNTGLENKEIFSQFNTVLGLNVNISNAWDLSNIKSSPLDDLRWRGVLNLALRGKKESSIRTFLKSTGLSNKAINNKFPKYLLDINNRYLMAGPPPINMEMQPKYVYGKDLIYPECGPGSSRCKPMSDNVVNDSKKLGGVSLVFKPIKQDLSTDGETNLKEVITIAKPLGKLSWDFEVPVE